MHVFWGVRLILKRKSLHTNLSNLALFFCRAFYRSVPFCGPPRGNCVHHVDTGSARFDKETVLPNSGLVPPSLCCLCTILPPQWKAPTTIKLKWYCINHPHSIWCFSKVNVVGNSLVLLVVWYTGCWIKLLKTSATSCTTKVNQVC